MTNIIKASQAGNMITKDAESEIIYIEKTMKELKKQYDDLKARMIDEMRSKGILKASTDNITVTYIAPTDRESFDSKAFRNDHPDAYDQYVKISPVKESIRIKVNG